MKKLLLVIILATCSGELLAQGNGNTTVPPSTLNKTFPFKPDTTINSQIIKDLSLVPQTNMKALPKGIYDIKALDKMPIIALQGYSKMPVVKLRGNSKMPVVGKTPSKNDNVVIVERP
ncbi:hypothetical protein [Mucilaginibacter terrenus]|nr:hypothetical protein [Mucilaginibacter terrenus]